MHNLHDLESLRGQTKHYALSRVGRFGVDEITEGWNEIVLTNSGSQPVRIVGLELAVRPVSR